MMMRKVLVSACLASLTVSGVAAQVMSFTKVQIGEKIRKVEDGVDEFRKWAENRGEQGKNSAEAAKAAGRTRGRTATEGQKEVAKDKKDDLENALDDLNKSTNRLKRKFEPTDSQKASICRGLQLVAKALKRSDTDYGRWMAALG